MVVSLQLSFIRPTMQLEPPPAPEAAPTPLEIEGCIQEACRFAWAQEKPVLALIARHFKVDYQKLRNRYLQHD
jgi:hypothetical protein